MQRSSPQTLDDRQFGMPAPGSLMRHTGSHIGAESDEDFMTLLAAYRRSGGLARACEVVSVLESCGGPGLAQLARWIVERRVISVDWQGQTWLPWFQFRHLDRLPDAALGTVLAEWAGVCDDEALAHWFARPNSTLDGRTPLAMLDDDPDAVLQAARADRYIAEG